jgi:hypothetical protein
MYSEPMMNESVDNTASYNQSAIEEVESDIALSDGEI